MPGCLLDGRSSGRATRPCCLVMGIKGAKTWGRCFIPLTFCHCRGAESAEIWERCFIPLALCHRRGAESAETWGRCFIPVALCHRRGAESAETWGSCFIPLTFCPNQHGREARLGTGPSRSRACFTRTRTRSEARVRPSSLVSQSARPQLHPDACPFRRDPVQARGPNQGMIRLRIAPTTNRLFRGPRGPMTCPCGRVFP